MSKSGLCARKCLKFHLTKGNKLHSAYPAVSKPIFFPDGQDPDICTGILTERGAKCTAGSAHMFASHTYLKKGYYNISYKGGRENVAE